MYMPFVLIIILLLTSWYLLPAWLAGDYPLAFCLSTLKHQVVCTHVGLSFCSRSHGAHRPVCQENFQWGEDQEGSQPEISVQQSCALWPDPGPCQCHLRVQNLGKKSPCYSSFHLIDMLADSFFIKKLTLASSKFCVHSGATKLTHFHLEGVLPLGWPHATDLINKRVPKHHGFFACCCWQVEKYLGGVSFF